MAFAKFHEAIAYALSCVGRQDLTLTMKYKQEEALVVVDRRTGRACLVPAGYGKLSYY